MRTIYEGWRQWLLLAILDIPSARTTHDIQICALPRPERQWLQYQDDDVAMPMAALLPSVRSAHRFKRQVGHTLRRTPTGTSNHVPVPPDPANCLQAGVVRHVDPYSASKTAVVRGIRIYRGPKGLIFDGNTCSNLTVIFLEPATSIGRRSVT